MAFDVTDRYFQANASPIKSTPYTLAGLLNSNGDSKLAFVYNFLGSGFAQLVLRTGVAETPKRSANHVCVNISSSISRSFVDSSFPINVYALRAAIASSDNARVAFLDTTKSNTDTENISISSFNSMSLGGMSGASTESAQIAECAIWSAALTDDEIDSLSKGFKPPRIRPQSLVFYAPLVRAAIDVRRGLALTPVNSPTVAAHPRVY